MTYSKIISLSSLLLVPFLSNVAIAGSLGDGLSDPVVFPPPLYTTDSYNGLPPEERSPARPAHVISEPGNSYAVNGLGGVPSRGESGVIIPFGDMKFASLKFGFNSDNPRGLPIFADMSDIDANGRPTVFDGAVLKGEISYSAQNASIIFNEARLRDGRQVEIEAIAVSGSSGNTGVAQRVNRHVIERYGSLFLGGLIEGFGQIGLARLRNDGENQPVIVVDGAGNTVTVKPRDEFDDRDAIAAALEPVGRNLSQVAQSGFNRPHTISAKAGMPFAVVFVSTVTSDQLNGGRRN